MRAARPPATSAYTIEAKVTEFWNLVDRSGGPDACWPWTGYVEKGYGRFRYRDRMIGAHELALTFTTGEARVPDLDTCHSCDTPLCCNPAHLRFDTRQSNVDDAVDRQRHARGSTNGQAKLTEADVLDIRTRAASGATGRSLAAAYNISEGFVTEIIRGRRWKHVGGPVRTTHGNRKRRAHLTEALVVELREAAAAGATVRGLASRYKISESYVSDIVRGRAWCDAGGPIRTVHGNRKQPST